MNRDHYTACQDAYDAAVKAGLWETAAAVRDELKKMRAELITRKGNVIYLEEWVR